MTKDKNDHQTTDMLQRPRGRPRTGAKSGAERQRAYRKKARAEDMASLSVMVSVEARLAGGTGGRNSTPVRPKVIPVTCNDIPVLTKDGGGSPHKPPAGASRGLWWQAAGHAHAHQCPAPPPSLKTGF